MSGKERIVTPEAIDTQGIIANTARLSQILAQEVELIKAMKVSEIAKLQEEKIHLTNLLEAQKKVMRSHPHLVETIPSSDREDLKVMAEMFEDILEENHRRLKSAKEVHEHMVGLVGQVLREAYAAPVYSDNGSRGMSSAQTLSMSYNNAV